MTTLTIAEVNCTTGEVVERPMTTEEQAAHLAAVQDAEEKEATRKVESERVALLKASARAKLVAGEPLTEEEAATIVL